MPRLFLPNIAAGVIPKDVSYPSQDIRFVISETDIAVEMERSNSFSCKVNL